MRQLLDDGIIRRARGSPRMVRRWSERAQHDLEAAKTLGESNPDLAHDIAYGAAFRACAGILNLAGYRLRSQPGHHAATIEGALAVLGDRWKGILHRVDRARERRNASLYDVPIPISRQEAAQLRHDADELLDEVRRCLALVPSESPSD